MAEFEGGVEVSERHFSLLRVLVVGGVRMYTDHRNLAYIFELEACVSSVRKTAAQRLEN